MYAGTMQLMSFVLYSLGVTVTWESVTIVNDNLARNLQATRLSASEGKTMAETTVEGQTIWGMSWKSRKSMVKLLSYRKSLVSGYNCNKNTNIHSTALKLWKISCSSCQHGNTPPAWFWFTWNNVANIYNRCSIFALRTSWNYRSQSKECLVEVYRFLEGIHYYFCTKSSTVRTT